MILHNLKEIKSLFCSLSNRKKLVFASFLTGLIFFFLNEGWQHHNDSIKYLNTLERVKTGEGWYHGGIMLRPGAVYIAYILSFLGSESAFGLQNFMFYILTSSLMYSFTKSLLSDSFLSVYSSLLFMFSFPVFYWGLSIGNDMGSWFFILLSLFLILESNENDFSNKSILLAGFITGLGILYKTSIIVIPAVLFLFLFLKYQTNTINRMKIMIIFTSLSIFPVIINQIYLLNSGFDSNYWDHFLKPILAGFVPSLADSSQDWATEDSNAFRQTYTYGLLTFFIAFPLIPFIFLSYLFLPQMKIRKYNDDLLSLYIYTVIILVFFYGVYSPRFSFLLFPVVFLFTVWYFDKFLDYITTFYFKKQKDLLWKIFIVLFFFTNLMVSIYSVEMRDFLGLWPSKV